MTNYTSLESALRLIPRPLFEQANRLDFLSWMLDGYRELKLREENERKVKIFEVEDGKVELPQEIKEINLVSFLYRKPTNEDIYSLQSCVCDQDETTTTTEDTNSVLQYSLAYRMFLNSRYYNNNYIPMQYKGNSSSLLCRNCPNRTSECQYVFTIDKDKMLYTNVTEGYICIDYDTEVVDENSIPMIPDSQDMKQYLAYYAQYRHWEERAAGKEESAPQMAERNLQKANIYFNKVKGSRNLRALDANTIASVRNDNYDKWVKIPEVYVYSR